MAKIVKKRRGTTLEHSTFTGAIGELTVNTDLDTVVVHDGVTVGGFSLARSDGTNLTGSSAGSIGLSELNISGAAGTAGQVLSTDGSGNLTFISLSTQTLGGDLSGTISNAQIKENTVGVTELNVADGVANTYLTTDGSGNLSFGAINVTGATTGFAVAMSIALG
tara:strand:+ start:472 stop:966 length:495 start_codon:yes stop_codon:yes gene_type:complete